MYSFTFLYTFRLGNKRKVLCTKMRDLRKNEIGYLRPLGLNI